MIRSENMKKFYFTLVALLIILANPASGQSETGAILKAGFFPYIHQHDFNAMAAHVEFEGAFKRSPFLTSGPRLDYINVFGPGHHLMIGYDLKLYPLYKKSRGPYRGLFIGVEAGYFPRKVGNEVSNDFGPCAGPLLGYQHIFNDKLSLSFETSMPFVANCSYLFANISVGVLHLW